MIIFYLKSNGTIFQDDAGPAKPRKDGFKVMKGKKKSNKKVHHDVINISNRFECLENEEYVFDQSKVVINIKKSLKNNIE